MSLTVTYEREGRGQREKHAVTVHGERDGEVHGQTAQHEESIHRRPVRHLEPQLRTHRENTLLFYSKLEKCIRQDYSKRKGFPMPGC